MAERKRWTISNSRTSKHLPANQFPKLAQWCDNPTKKGIPNLSSRTSRNQRNYPFGLVSSVAIRAHKPAKESPRTIQCYPTLRRSTATLSRLPREALQRTVKATEEDDDDSYLDPPPPSPLQKPGHLDRSIDCLID